MYEYVGRTDLYQWEVYGSWEILRMVPSKGVKEEATVKGKRKVHEVLFCKTLHPVPSACLWHNNSHVTGTYCSEEWPTETIPCECDLSLHCNSFHHTIPSIS